MRPPARAPATAPAATAVLLALLAVAAGCSGRAGDVEVLGDRREPDAGPPLVGTTWVLESILPPPDELSTAAASTAVEATVTFGIDGTYAIQTTCNSGSGRYERTAARGRTIELDLGPPSVTRRACGAAGSSIVETAVLTTFVAGPAEAVLGEHRLTITTPTGSLGFRAR